MQVFVIIAQTGTELRVVSMSWVKSDATQRALTQMQEDSMQDDLMQHTIYRVLPIDIDPLRWLVQDYFTFRHYVEPRPDQAFKFLTSEIGELAEALVQQEECWVRNNPTDKSAISIAAEIGDVLMMLTKLAEKYNIDPLTAMVEKFKSKGWTNE